jgi:O-6-methylguanine DNA methyltransferase
MDCPAGLIFISFAATNRSRQLALTIATTSGGSWRPATMLALQTRSDVRKAMDLKMAKRKNRSSAEQPIEQIRFSLGRSPIGMVLVASSDKGVVSIQIGDNPSQLVIDLEQRFPRAELFDGDRESESRLSRVIKSIEKPARALDLPLDVRGTAFQKRVWQAVSKIPAGKTATYKDIARKIGAPRAMRAVGNACAANNLALAIPCHRVLRINGSLRPDDPVGTCLRDILLNRETKAMS